MARIKITMPETILDTFHIPVRITDINYGNHLGNDGLVSIVHDARMQWLKKHGYTELQIEGIGLIMSDLAVEYTGESFYGDVLDVSIASAEITKLSFELYYSVSTNRNGQPVNIAKAKTGMVCFNYELKKVAAMPEQLKAILTSS